MGDLTKWEAKSAKINFVTPIVGIVAIFLLVGIAAILKPKPPEPTKKKDKDAAGVIEEVTEEEEVDWDNF